MSEKELDELKKEEEKKEAAIKEEERLDKLVQTYFNNGLNPTVAEDNIGLNMGLAQPIEMIENTEKETTKESDSKEEKPDKPLITEEEEEVFLVHDDGQITSEIKESEESDLKEGYGIARQTIIEKAIYNKAIRNIYKSIEKYQSVLNKLSSHSEVSVLSRLLEQDTSKFVSSIRGYRGELNATGFSQYADIPIEEIDLYKIETDELRRAVDLEIEKITLKTINGGIE